MSISKIKTVHSDPDGNVFTTHIPNCEPYFCLVLVPRIEQGTSQLLNTYCQSAVSPDPLFVVVCVTSLDT